MKRFLVATLVVCALLSGVRKYEESWEYDTAACGVQIHAIQCLDGKVMVEY